MWEPSFTPMAGLFASSLFAFLPLAVLLIGLGWFKLPSYKVCFASLVISVIISIILWKTPGIYVLQAVGEGFAMGAWPILWVIIAAIYTYNITVSTGAMNTIKSTLASISPDRRIQALILAFSFGGFLEAAAGFGTAVAIPASLLAGIGFDPFFAAIICLVANTIPVAFGGIGIPVITLAQVTGLPLSSLTASIAYQLVIFIVVLPFILVLLLTKSLKGLKGVFGASLVCGSLFALFQTLFAVYIGPEVAALVGALISLAGTIIYVKKFPIKDVWLFKGEDKSKQASASLTDDGKMSLLTAWMPYIVLFFIIMGLNLIPSLKFLGKSPFAFSFQFFYGPGGKPVSFQWITTPGTIMIVSAILGGIVQGAKFKQLFSVFVSTVRQLLPTIGTVLFIVAMAKIMSYSGMISTIAIALASVTGKAYPFISPMIGALGTFVTGSDTSANILFGSLQKQVALKIGSDPVWLAAANATGATAGKMISPQSIAVAASATGMVGKEGKILNKTLPFCIIYSLLLGLEILLFS